MKRASITQLKAKLSEYLEVVKTGEEVLVTDRGRAVARITPVRGVERVDAHLETLIRTGRVRLPRSARPLRLDRLLAGAPRDPDGRSLAALLGERRERR
jgi:prevent-host-death family protein